ncbi:hypothetical protein D3C71_1489110 [compost metagenome]
MNVFRSRPRHVSDIELITIRREALLRCPGAVLPILNHCRRQGCPTCLSVFVGGVPPIGLPCGPFIAEPVGVGVAILADYGGDPLRIGRRYPEPDRCAVVEHVKCVAVEAERLGEPSDDIGEVIKCVSKILTLRRDGLAEPRKVRCDDAVPICQ